MRLTLALFVIVLVFIEPSWGQTMSLVTGV
jgi:hypothetical protein